jgi:hypothetical protein
VQAVLPHRRRNTPLWAFALVRAAPVLHDVAAHGCDGDLLHGIRSMSTTAPTEPTLDIAARANAAMRGASRELVLIAAILALSTGLAWADPPTAAESPTPAAETPSAETLAARRVAFNDHLAYVASFMAPAQKSVCAKAVPGYAETLAMRYLDWMDAQQTRIERGRRLTAATLEAGESLDAYREALIAKVLAQIEAEGTEKTAKRCQAMLALFDGRSFDGEWPTEAELAARKTKP